LAIASFAPGNVQLIVNDSHSRVDVRKTVSAELNILNDPKVRIQHH
jgi:hypothetical protein